MFLFGYPKKNIFIIFGYQIICMKLVANKSDEYNGKTYYKYIITIPSKNIKELKWNGGEELETEVRNGELVIKKK